MNILTIKLIPGSEDYLECLVLQYLRSLPGCTVTDWPRTTKNYSFDGDKDQRFGVFGLLEEPENISRDHVFTRANQGEFDRIFVFTRWGADLGELNKLDPSVCFTIIDGGDLPELIELDRKIDCYYKRELILDQIPQGIKPISFAMPNSKIVQTLPEKTQLFATHNQVPGMQIFGLRTYVKKQKAFKTEQLYYEDIAASLYATTRKKAGWDCMRHYEIAAQGTVPVFWNLDQKPLHCAPHGLKDMHNCVSFASAQELEQKITWIEQNNCYSELQANTLEWVNQNSVANCYQSLVGRKPKR